MPEERALERLKRLPTEAAPPHHKAAAVRALGTADANALAIESKALFSSEELKAKAEAARQRRVEAGIQDNVENMQPLRPPAFDQELVGKRIEVRAYAEPNSLLGSPRARRSPSLVTLVTAHAVRFERST